MGVVGSVDLISAKDIIPRLSFYKIDIPDRPWVKGFPGYPHLTKWFGVCYDGGFDVAIAGDYTVVTAVDDSVAIWIDEKLILNNNDGTITHTVVNNMVNSKGPKSTVYNPGPVGASPIYLTAGLHRVMIEYMQGYPTTLGVRVWVQPPGAGGVPTSKDLMRLVGPPHGILSARTEIACRLTNGNTNVHTILMRLAVGGFQWDRANRLKCEKHGVPLAVIESIFNRPVAVFPDPAHSDKEERFKAIGKTAMGAAY